LIACLPAGRVDWLIKKTYKPFKTNFNPNKKAAPYLGTAQGKT